MIKTRTVLPLLIICLMSLPIGAADQILSLDGQWEILFDHDNTGRKAGWHLDRGFSAQGTKRHINVPGAWELIEQDYEGVAFYRRT